MMTKHTGDGSPLFGARLASGSAPKAYSLGRKCQESDCGEMLSRYNSTKWCARHESAVFLSKHPPLRETKRVHSNTGAG
jgi:hypothetical protein